MRKIYVVTERDIKKAKKCKEQAEYQLNYIEENKNKLRKKYGLKKRDAVASFHKGSLEYHRGVGQGRLDQLSGLPYDEKRLNPEYNMGYHQGFCGNSGEWIKNIQGKNENFDWYFEKKEEKINA